MRGLGWALLGSTAALVSVVSASAWLSWSTPELTSAASVRAVDGTPGSAIYIQHDSERSSACSLGVPWRLQDGQEGWLGAAHCFEGSEPVIGESSVLGRMVAADISNDVAWIAAREPVLPELNVNGRRTPITSWSRTQAGQDVCVLGNSSGLTCGWRVVEEDGAVPGQDGQEIYGATARGRGDNCVRQGDSGGVVFSLDRSGVSVKGTVIAVADNPGIGKVIPATCTIVYTPVEQARQIVGGEPISTAAY